MLYLNIAFFLPLCPWKRLTHALPPPLIRKKNLLWSIFMDSFLLLNAKPNRWWTESNTEESADLPNLAWRNEGVLATVVMWAGWGKRKAPDSASTREVPLSPAFYFEVHYRSMFTGNTSCLQEKRRKKAWNPLQYKGHRGRGWCFFHTKEKIFN